MMLFLDVLIIILLFSLFGVFHTILASNKLKERIRDNSEGTIAFYRLFYNIFAIVSLIAVYALAPKPRLIIYDLPNPYDLIVFAFQAAALAGFFWAGFSVDAREFFGINQVIRYLRNNYDETELDEHSELHTIGPYKISRHPLYLFAILFLGLRPAMDLFYLTFFLCITVYFFIGSYYEEKKLVEKFGEEYKQYQSKVPRIFPIKLN